MRTSVLAGLALLVVALPLSAQTDANVVEKRNFQDFTYRVTVDPIDDSKTYFLATETEGADSWGEIMTGGAGFGLVCYEGQPHPRVIVVSAAYLAEEPATVYYRFDDREAVGPVDWKVVSSSLQSSQLTATTRPETNALISDATTATQMVFRIEDNIDEGAQHTYTFSMHGISAGMTQMPCVD